MKENSKNATMKILPRQHFPEAKICVQDCTLCSKAAFPLINHCAKFASHVGIGGRPYPGTQCGYKNSRRLRDKRLVRPRWERLLACALAEILWSVWSCVCMCV